MFDSLTASEYFRNAVSFLELGYDFVLDLTSGGAVLDAMMKETSDILDSASGLLKHYETLLRPEEYAEYTAKHRTRGGSVP
ncbi:hypothetical protein FRC10_004503 [Ceratobasidium sp. 414]|nr:hypothetical protein FRC10_004503 [Ceratobasidium sp. 414]